MPRIAILHSKHVSAILYIAYFVVINVDSASAQQDSHWGIWSMTEIITSFMANWMLEFIIWTVIGITFLGSRFCLGNFTKEK
jgi:hypothetical protein